MKTVNIYGVSTKQYENSEPVTTMFCAATPRQLLDLVERWMKKQYVLNMVGFSVIGKIVVA